MVRVRAQDKQEKMANTGVKLKHIGRNGKFTKKLTGEVWANIVKQFLLFTNLTLFTNLSQI